jgi:hypothetical protein
LEAAEANIALCTATGVRTVGSAMWTGCYSNARDSDGTGHVDCDGDDMEDAMDAAQPLDCRYSGNSVAADHGASGSPGRSPVDVKASEQQQQDQKQGLRDLQLRWLWLHGRLADARRQPGNAQAAFEACREHLLASSPATTDAAAAADDVTADDSASKSALRVANSAAGGHTAIPQVYKMRHHISIHKHVI